MDLFAAPSIAKRPGNPAGFPGSVWLLLTSDLVSATGVGLTQPYLVVLLHAVRGFPLAVATSMVALAAITSLVGNPVARALIDRRGARTVWWPSPPWPTPSPRTSYAAVTTPCPASR